MPCPRPLCKFERAQAPFVERKKKAKKWQTKREQKWECQSEHQRAINGRYWSKHSALIVDVHVCLCPRIKIDIKRLFRQRYRYDLTNKRVVQQFSPVATHRRAFTCDDDIVSAVSAGWPKWATDYRNLASWPHNRADPN